MCDGVVIEGHIVERMRDELVRESGTVYDLVNWMTHNCGIAMTPKVEVHWRMHCSDRDQFFWSWYTEQVEKRSIRPISPRRLDNKVSRKIHNDFGLPRNTLVRRYIECANGTNDPRYILAEEMDLHAPQAKRLPTRTQVQIREMRSGILCRYLERALRIRVGSLSDCIVYFSTDSGNCASSTSSNGKSCPRLPKG